MVDPYENDIIHVDMFIVVDEVPCIVLYKSVVDGEKRAENNREREEAHDKLLELSFDKHGNVVLGVWGSVLAALALTVANTDLS